MRFFKTWCHLLIQDKQSFSSYHSNSVCPLHYPTTFEWKLKERIKKITADLKMGNLNANCYCACPEKKWLPWIFQHSFWGDCRLRTQCASNCPFLAQIKELSLFRQPRPQTSSPPTHAVSSLGPTVEASSSPAKGLSDWPMVFLARQSQAD